MLGGHSAQWMTVKTCYFQQFAAAAADLCDSGTGGGCGG